MSVEGFRASFKLDGVFITEQELLRLTKGLENAGYTLRTSGYAIHEDGVIAGFWYFTLDNTVVLRALPDKEPKNGGEPGEPG